jgi:hypothetical protein
MTSWRALADADAARTLLARAGGGQGHGLVVAIDGRSGAGKSTVAERLAARLPRSAVVHTDDIAWSESFFDWGAILLEGVIEPFRSGHAVSFRPPAWDRHGRPGEISVPAGTQVLLVEGVGSGRRALAAHLDAVVWVQADMRESERRGVDRDGAGRSDPQEFWDRWQAEEMPFLARDRPWDRADLVVCGTPELTGARVEGSTELLVATA